MGTSRVWVQAGQDKPELVFFERCSLQKVLESWKHPSLSLTGGSSSVLALQVQKAGQGSVRMGPQLSSSGLRATRTCS